MFSTILFVLIYLVLLALTLVFNYGASVLSNGPHRHRADHQDPDDHDRAEEVGS